MKTITVLIDKDGNISIESAGFKGQACTKATAALEKALGTTSKDKKLTEYYQENVNTQSV